MRKTVFAVGLALAVVSTACSHQNTDSNLSGESSSSITMLEDGVWPENEHTDGLPVCSGTVSWAVLDEEKGYCGISLVDVSDEVYNAYMQELKDAGFSVVDETSEEIDGEDYVSIGTVLSDGEKGLSISRIPDNLVLYISAAE